jgi:GntR family transcriptional regulator
VSGEDVLTDQVDSTSDRPVYKQIADFLRSSIARGRLHEGDQLPSEAQLMQHYGVARMTIRNAIRLLQDEGLVVSEHGRGVYVRNRPPVKRLASDPPHASDLVFVPGTGRPVGWFPAHAC